MIEDIELQHSERKLVKKLDLERLDSKLSLRTASTMDSDTLRIVTNSPIDTDPSSERQNS